jgi:hypothetical protein
MGAPRIVGFAVWTATLVSALVRPSHALELSLQSDALHAAVREPTRAGWFAFQLFAAGSEHALGAGPNFGINLRVHAWRHIYVDAGASAGFVFAAGPGDHVAGPHHHLGDAFYFKLWAGVTGSTGANLEGWEGLAFFRATHVHLASLEAWKATPFENFVADSHGSVLHQAGFEAGLGVIGPQIMRLGRHFDLILEADALFEMLPTSDVMYWTAGVRLNLSLRMIRP